MRVNLSDFSSSSPPCNVLGVRDLIYFIPRFVHDIYIVLLAILQDSVLDMLEVVFEDLLLMLLSLYSHNVTTIIILSMFIIDRLCTYNAMLKGKNFPKAYWLYIIAKLNMFF